LVVAAGPVMTTEPSCLSLLTVRWCFRRWCITAEIYHWTVGAEYRRMYRKLGWSSAMICPRPSVDCVAVQRRLNEMAMAVWCFSVAVLVAADFNSQLKESLVVTFVCQGRQKLAKFNKREFATLIIDILNDAKRRYGTGAASPTNNVAGQPRGDMH